MAWWEGLGISLEFGSQPTRRQQIQILDLSGCFGPPLEPRRAVTSIEVAGFERNVQRAAQHEHDAEPLLVVDGFATSTSGGSRRP